MILSVQGITVRYGKRLVLDALSLPDLGPGLTVLAGPNAAGKSTLLRAIANLAAHSGRVMLDGVDLGRQPPAKRAATLGFMPQALPSGSSLIVLESVIAALRASGEAPRADEAALAVLERLGIEALAFRRLDQLSGGQRQMVGLAQALVRGPQVLLLDEPTSALDLAYQTRLLTELRRQADEGRIVIAVLHDLSLAAQWADRIAVIADGRLHSTGTPAEVLTREMLASVYRVDARVETCGRGRTVILVDAEYRGG
ncbi:ABC transporter ATP-binding protein [Cereibacter sp. SYSU M97828]|nr:ABC transporter ATP-binding protein [Cereibacter flavus]